MRILQIISGREVNGALVYCRLLTHELIKAGHDVTVICRPGSWLADQDFSAKRVESNMRRFFSTDLREARNLVLREKVDIVHTHMSRAHTFGVLLKWITGVPLVATAHNRHLQVHWKFNDFVIANSRATERYHRRCNLVSASRIRPIHCFVDLQRFQQVGPRDRKYVRNELRCTNGEFIVGVVGEVIPRKGQLYLLQGLEELVRRIPNLQMVLLGRFHRSEAYVRRLRRIQADAALYRRVRWLGRRSNIHQHMAALDILVVPSIEEPLGLVAVEAQAAGTPVIAANTGGLPEIVQNERNGLLVPPANTGALVEAISRLHRDRELATTLVRNGRIDASSKFSPATLTREVINVYEQVLSLRRRNKVA